MTPAPPRAGPRPIRLAVAAEPVPIARDVDGQGEETSPAVPPVAADGHGPIRPRSETPDLEARTAGGGEGIDARLAALEARQEAQDAALRRVLTLLVDWVEADARGESRPGLAELRDAAA